MNKTTKAWEKIFQQGGKVFLYPHEDMNMIAQTLNKQGAKRILDLGSGSGRHVISKLSKMGSNAALQS